MATSVFSVDALIEAFGDQAYHRAVGMVIEALRAGHAAESRALSEAARELMRRGYHKKPEVKNGD